MLPGRARHQAAGQQGAALRWRGPADGPGCRVSPTPGWPAPLPPGDGRRADSAPGQLGWPVRRGPGRIRRGGRLDQKTSAIKTALIFGTAGEARGSWPKNVTLVNASARACAAGPRVTHCRTVTVIVPSACFTVRPQLGGWLPPGLVSDGAAHGGSGRGHIAAPGRPRRGSGGGPAAPARPILLHRGHLHAATLLPYQGDQSSSVMKASPSVRA